MGGGDGPMRQDVPVKDYMLTEPESFGLGEAVMEVKRQLTTLSVTYRYPDSTIPQSHV